MVRIAQSEREQLFASHWKLACWFSARLSRQNKLIARLTGEDRAQVAALALLETIDAWEPARGKLSTLLSWVVRQRLQEASLHSGVISLPGSVSMGGFDEMPDHLVRKVIAAMTPAPIAHQATTWTARRDPEPLCGFDELTQRVYPREKQVLEMRFCDGLTLSEVASAIGVSREMARQIEKRGIERLRRRMKDHERG